MNQSATETTAMPTTLTLINPTQDDTAQVVAEETTLTALEERQNLLAHHVRLRRPWHERGALRLWVAGRFGQVPHGARTLADEGISPVLVNSHITPLALYSTLYFNRSGKVVFFDDVDCNLRLDVAPGASAGGSLG